MGPPRTTALFDEEDGVPTQLTVNEAYEKKYSKRKDREELHKLSKSLKDVAETDASSSSEEEEEDSDAELLTRELDAKILETITKIQAKDPIIYKKDQVFFKDTDFGDDRPNKNTTTKPLTFTKFMHSALKNEGADVFVREEERFDDEETEAVASKQANQTKVVSYEEEQRAIKDVGLYFFCGLFVMPVYRHRHSYVPPRDWRAATKAKLGVCLKWQ